VLAVIAIDKLCANLTNQQGKFRMKLFKSINEDRVLNNEILVA
jgi:hypothetical protein